MGPKFFQTGMGKKFFEGDIPRLIRVLEKIADGLSPKILSDLSPPLRVEPEMKPMTWLDYAKNAEMHDLAVAAKAKARAEAKQGLNFNTDVQREAARMMHSGPLEVGDLRLTSGYPNADDLTIASAAGLMVTVSRDENGDVWIIVGDLLSFKLGESMTPGTGDE